MSAASVPQVLIGVKPMEPLLPAMSSHTTGGERGHFNSLGFLMGFALSATIGVVLYIYLTAG